MDERLFILTILLVAPVLCPCQTFVPISIPDYPAPEAPSFPGEWVFSQDAELGWPMLLGCTC